MKRLALLAVVAAGVASLQGCAPGDVELNGRLFELAGIATGSNADRKTPKLEERAPLILPPSMDRLPPPDGSSQAAQAALPVDPEQRSRLSKSALQQQQAAYCKEHYEKPLALGDRATAETARGPLGLCAPSALQSMTGNNPLVQR